MIRALALLAVALLSVGVAEGRGYLGTGTVTPPSGADPCQTQGVDNITCLIHPLCAAYAPPSTPENPIAGHTWYVDPVNGDDSHAGTSAATAWKTVASLTSSGSWGTARITSGQVQPGDTVFLETGSYGIWQIGSQTVTFTNSDWISIAADGAAIPTFSFIDIQGGSKFRFSRLKVRDAAALVTHTALVRIGYKNASANIAIDHSDIAAAEDATAATWTQSDWRTNATIPAIIAFASSGGSSSCVSLYHDRFHNTYGGVQAQANDIWIVGSEIDHSSGDESQLTSSHIYYQADYLHDPVMATPNHADFIQFLSPSGGSATDIKIINNKFIRRADFTFNYPSQIQGIWNGYANYDTVAVIGNMISLNESDAMRLDLTTNLFLAHNTIVCDAHPTVCGSYAPAMTMLASATYNYRVAVNNFAWSISEAASHPANYYQGGNAAILKYSIGTAAQPSGTNGIPVTGHQSNLPADFASYSAVPGVTMNHIYILFPANLGLAQGTGSNYTAGDTINFLSDTVVTNVDTVHSPNNGAYLMSVTDSSAADTTTPFGPASQKTPSSYTCALSCTGVSVLLWYDWVGPITSDFDPSNSSAARGHGVLQASIPGWAPGWMVLPTYDMNGVPFGDTSRNAGAFAP